MHPTGKWIKLISQSEHALRLGYIIKYQSHNIIFIIHHNTLNVHYVTIQYSTVQYITNLTILW